MEPLLIHATCICVNGRGVLIRGPSGSGKSDLALRCLATAPSAVVPMPAVLVADDQVLLTVTNGALVATAPASIRGLLEIRGIGIVTLSSVPYCNVVLVADLQTPDTVIERLPDPAPTVEILTVHVPQLLIKPFEASAVSKLLVALSQQPN
jgi:HPr kinase/phosphorylase